MGGRGLAGGGTKTRAVLVFWNQQELELSESASSSGTCGVSRRNLDMAHQGRELETERGSMAYLTHKVDSPIM
jgi:hypothetical protein